MNKRIFVLSCGIIICGYANTKTQAQGQLRSPVLQGYHQGYSYRFQGQSAKHDVNQNITIHKIQGHCTQGQRVINIKALYGKVDQQILKLWDQVAISHKGYTGYANFAHYTLKNPPTLHAGPSVTVRHKQGWMKGQSLTIHHDVLTLMGPVQGMWTS